MEDLTEEVAAMALLAIEEIDAGASRVHHHAKIRGISISISIWQEA